MEQLSRQGRVLKSRLYHKHHERRKQISASPQPYRSVPADPAINRNLHSNAPAGFGVTVPASPVTVHHSLLCIPAQWPRPGRPASAILSALELFCESLTQDTRASYQFCISLTHFIRAVFRAGRFRQKLSPKSIAFNADDVHERSNSLQIMSIGMFSETRHLSNLSSSSVQEFESDPPVLTGSIRGLPILRFEIDNIKRALAGDDIDNPDRIL